MPDLEFLKLNVGWNAHPNIPEPEVTLDGTVLRLKFLLNPYAYRAAQGETGMLTFMGCEAWRLGSVNDEGWYLGQCRYGKAAAGWGEFYELVGNDEARYLPEDWMSVSGASRGSRHFLFYLRDETFECLAADWSFKQDL